MSSRTKDLLSNGLKIAGGVLGLIVAAIVILDWLGVNAAGDLVTEVRAAELDTAQTVVLEAKIGKVEAKHDQLQALNASHHRQYERDMVSMKDDGVKQEDRTKDELRRIRRTLEKLERKLP